MENAERPLGPATQGPALGPSRAVNGRRTLKGAKDPPGRVVWRGR